jgi:hypothetical protein
METPEQVIDWLMYASYRANRGYGMKAEDLFKLGFPPRFEALYAMEVARAA